MGRGDLGKEVRVVVVGDSLVSFHIIMGRSRARYGRREVRAKSGGTISQVMSEAADIKFSSEGGLIVVQREGK